MSRALNGPAGGGNGGPRLGDELRAFRPRPGDALGATPWGRRAGGDALCRRLQAGRARECPERVAGGDSTLCHTGVRAGAPWAAVWWKRGRLMPTGAADEGTPRAAVRGHPLPTIKTHDQDSVRALSTSLSADERSCGPRPVGALRRRRRPERDGAARALVVAPNGARPPASRCITMHIGCINTALLVFYDYVTV